MILDDSGVDPESGLDEEVHVYTDYSVNLGLVDIENNKNSYYRMQLLESDKTKL